MLWDGNRQAQEYTDTHVFTTIYEQNSFEPVARLVWLKDELLKAANDEIKNAERESWEDAPTLIPSMQVFHYHNDHLGTPNELTNQQGEVVWLADYEAWGNTAKVVWREEKLEQLQVSANELQPIRFQGQSFDTETGLHYNRFRYFDPDLGMFTTRDPIGLLGGNNVFQYAPNPTGWIDPFGLAYVSGPRSPIVLSGKDKPNNATQHISEWRRIVCKKDVSKERNNFLGSNFVKVGPGKWRSLDGKRQFRVKNDDYSGEHGMGFPTVPNTPHVHMEFLVPKANGLNFTVVKNVHIPLKDC